MSDTFQALRAATPGEIEGLALARFVSRLGIEVRSPGTFVWDSRGDLAAAWRLWLETWFAPVLAPAFVEIHRLAGEMRPDEIAGQDRVLDRALSETLRTRSLAAGLAFLEGKSEMRANRKWTRFSELVAAGGTPGHATTLFALQSALYHLPLAPALSAYAWFELESGLLPHTGYRNHSGTGNDALALFASAIPHVQVAISGERGDFSAESPRLRAI